MTCYVPWPIPVESIPEALAILLRWLSDLHSASSLTVNVRCKYQISKREHFTMLSMLDTTFPCILPQNNVFLISVSFCLISPEGVPSWKHVHI